MPIRHRASKTSTDMNSGFLFTTEQNTTPTRKPAKSSTMPSTAATMPWKKHTTSTFPPFPASVTMRTGDLPCRAFRPATTLPMFSVCSCSTARCSAHRRARCLTGTVMPTSVRMLRGGTNASPTFPSTASSMSLPATLRRAMTCGRWSSPTTRPSGTKWTMRMPIPWYGTASGRLTKCTRSQRMFPSTSTATEK